MNSFVFIIAGVIATVFFIGLSVYFCKIKRNRKKRKENRDPNDLKKSYESTNTTPIKENQDKTHNLANKQENIVKLKNIYNELDLRFKNYQDDTKRIKNELDNHIKQYSQSSAIEKNNEYVINMEKEIALKVQELNLKINTNKHKEGERKSKEKYVLEAEEDIKRITQNSTIMINQYLMRMNKIKQTLDLIPIKNQTEDLIPIKDQTEDFINKVEDSKKIFNELYSRYKLLGDKIKNIKNEVEIDIRRNSEKETKYKRNLEENTYMKWKIVIISRKLNSKKEVNKYKDDELDNKKSDVIKAEERKNKIIRDSIIKEYLTRVNEIKQIYEFDPIISQCKMTRNDIKKEFDTIPKNKYKTKNFIALKEEKELKNRDINLYSYDFHMIELVKERSFHNLNNDESKFTLQDATVKYIAAPVPEVEAHDYYWRLVWQENISTIVSLTKCNPYDYEDTDINWSKYKKFQNIKVRRFNNILPDAYFMIDSFIIQKDKEPKREVYHLHFFSWPAESLPDSYISMLEFIHIVNEYKSIKSIKDTGPLLVISNTGAGLTGTYIAIDFLSNKRLPFSENTVMDCVKNLSEQEISIVQTQEQYEFIYFILNEYRNYKRLEIKIEDRNISDKIKDNLPNLKSLNRHRYFQIKKTHRKWNIYDSCRNFYKRNKVRSNILDIDGYNVKGRYILAHHPYDIEKLFETVFKENVGLIIMLNNEEIIKKLNLANYWFSGLNIGPYKISFQANEFKDVVELTDGNKLEMIINRMQINRYTNFEKIKWFSLAFFTNEDWPIDEKLSYTNIKQMILRAKLLNNWCPINKIYIHSINGLHREELFVTLLKIFESLKKNKINIELACRTIIEANPEYLQNEEIISCLENYLNTFPEVLKEI